ncbi:hypothetical protein V1522DRAFT_432716 [Lipomyces starkeyi]
MSGSKYPQLWYDSTRHVAIIVAAPALIHGGNVGEFLKNSGKSKIQESVLK